MEPGHSLEETLDRGQSLLDGLVNAFENECRLGIVAIPAEYRLFLPDTGFFMFSAEHDAVAYTWAFAMPLSPTTLLAAVPKVARVNWAVMSTRIHSISVGRSKDLRRITIPPEYLEATDRPSLAAKIANRLDATEKMFSDISRLRELVASAYSRTLLPLPASVR